MTVYFCDSSALIKRYLVETGSDWIEKIATVVSEDTIFVAQVTQAEVVSGIARTFREGHLTADAANLARHRVDYHTSVEYNVIGLSARIVQRAEDLLLKYPLRAYDAVQLASALEVRLHLRMTREPLIFVSADRRLLAAAESEGLVTDDPNSH